MSDDPHLARGATLLAEARAALADHLRLGDERQIQASRFLAEAQEHYQHLKACRHCQEHELCPLGMYVGLDVEAAAWALLLGEANP